MTAADGDPKSPPRVLRTEDSHLVTGRTTWTSNVRMPGTAVLVFVRSPHPHARFSIDLTAAREAPGVLGAWSGSDIAPWCPVLPSLDDGPDMPLLAVDVVRYAGEAVAVVVARTAAEAADASELVDVDYEPLPVVTDAVAAVAASAAQLHESSPANTVVDRTREHGDVDEAFATAEVVVRRRFEQPRVFPAAMEPRAVVVQPTGTGYTAWVSTQTPHIVKHLMLRGARLRDDQLRVIAPDIGGGFGGKFSYAEELVVLWTAQRLQRPVSWEATRSEDLQTTFHGRALIQGVAVASTADGIITGLDVELLADTGAYSTPIGAGSAEGGLRMYPGIYKIANYRVRCRCVTTNKTPVGAYRGAGRPEATYAIERIVDELAVEVKLDPVELRRRNWIGAEEFPYRTAGGVTYDVGEYAATTDAMLELAGYDELRALQDATIKAGGSHRIGVGVSTYVESCGGGIRYQKTAVETAAVRLTPEGAEAVLGTTAYGTGHATTWAQIVSNQLGIALDAIRIVQGDTERAPHGFDSYGSRSLSVVGSALHEAAVQVRERATDVAGRMLECDPADLDLDGGTFTVRGTSASVSMRDVALASYRDRALTEDGFEPGLGCTRTTDLKIATYPYGAHLAVVEVDIETGRVALVDYVAIDDVGNVVNPMIVDGQVHGGVVQGIAQVLFEEVGYDEQANVVTPSFTEYALPSAADVIAMRTARHTTPATTNPLGTKGVGEAGAIAAPPAVMNAVLDALRPLGVTDVPMPCTPHRIWRAIQSATSG
jgi:aerobic carbon-monoxide dehydrogenase large subunit